MSGNNFRNIGDTIKNVIEDSKRIFNNERLVNGLSTGFYDLDYITRGLQKGHLVLLAGRRHMGKTAFALSIVYNAIVQQKVSTALFSPAMSDRQIIIRLLSMDSGIFYKDILNGLRSSNDWERLELSAKGFTDVPLFIDDSPLITVKDIRERCINIKSANKLELIVVDYLQLLSAEGYIDEQFNKKEVISSLKKLADEMDCPVMVLSELSSVGERQWNSRPEISDIEADDFTKQYADIIMFIYMNMLKSNADVNNDEAELTIVKNRDGLTGRIKLKSDLGRSRFLNII